MLGRKTGWVLLVQEQVGCYCSGKARSGVLLHQESLLKSHKRACTAAAQTMEGHNGCGGDEM